MYASSAQKNAELGPLLQTILDKKVISQRLSLELAEIEFLLPFGATGTEPTIWLIVETEAERTTFLDATQAQQEIRSLLKEGGYPADGAGKADVTIASLEQIEDAGGPQAFFR